VKQQLGVDERLAYRTWARNESRAIKPEDKDEKVVEWSCALTHYAEADETEYQERLAADVDTVRLTRHYDEKLKKVQDDAKEAGSQYSTIFSSPHCVKYIQGLLEMPMHFRHSKLLKLAGLSRMTEGNGGVSVRPICFIPRVNPLTQSMIVIVQPLLSAAR
jgi:hypothetical protein